MNFYISKFFTISTLLHFSLFAFFVVLKEPASWQEQTLNIELVDMSSFTRQENVAAEESEQIEVSKLDLEKADDGDVQENQKRSFRQKQESAVLKQTSGKQSKEALKEHSAQTDPVFNAEYLNNPSPIYPEKARLNKIEGKILLKVLVQKDGFAKSVDIQKSSGSSLLDNAALTVVREWKFIPAKRGNESVEANVIVPIEFKLR